MNGLTPGTTVNNGGFSMMAMDDSPWVNCYSLPWTQPIQNRIPPPLIKTEKSSPHRHQVINICDQCDFQSMDLTSLTKHIKYKHQGVLFSCDQCDYKTRYKGTLESHTKSKHQNKYCDYCEYQTRYKCRAEQAGMLGRKSSLKSTLLLLISQVCHLCDSQNNL